MLLKRWPDLPDSTIPSLLPVIFQRPDIQEQLSALDLSYLYCDEARDLSYLEADSVTRYQMVFYLSTLATSTASVPSLSQVAINVTTEN